MGGTDQGRFTLKPGGHRLDDGREAVYWWMIEYNKERPHDSLGDIPPVQHPKNTEVLFLNCPLDGKVYGSTPFGLVHLNLMVDCAQMAGQLACR